jgi:hypothetical protein
MWVSSFPLLVVVVALAPSLLEKAFHHRPQELLVVIPSIGSF